MAHHHRSSGLKQSNKSHKSNRASKRSINRAAGGKVQGRTSIKKKGGGVVSNGSKARADRANMAKQRRLASKEKLLHQKRVQGRLNIKNEDSAIVPRVVGIISLSEAESQLESHVRTFLVEGSDKAVGKSDMNTTSSVTAMYSKFKKEGHLTFLTNTSAFSSFYDTTHDGEECAVQSALDLCRVCDTIMLLVDGRDADKGETNTIAGMEIGGGAGGASVSTSATSGQDYDHLISSRGERVLSAIKAQGLPTPLTVLVNFEGDGDDGEMSLNSCRSMKSVRRSALKKKLGLKKYLTRFAETEFGEGSERVMELDIPDLDEEDETMNIDADKIISIGKSRKILPDALLNKTNDVYPSRAACVRVLCTMSASPPKWVSEMPRAYILSDSNGLNNEGYEYDEGSKELKIKGYIRGQAPLDVNNLVHVPNVGTFGVKCILKSEQSLSTLRKRKKQSDMTTDTINEILATGDSELREPLEMFANPDALDGEQNLIGFEDDEGFHDEDDDNKADEKGFKKGTARPAGWSDYQSAWMDAIGEDDAEDPFDHGELAFDLNKKRDDATVITKMDMDEEDANNVTAEERKILLDQRRKNQEEELMFPDEVEVDEDAKASERYARYRSLKSFRKSYWDPKENLPDSYGTIYHFSSFKATQGDIMAEMKDVIKASGEEFYARKEKKSNDNDDEMMDEDDDDDDILEGCVASGTFVTIVLEGVPLSAFKRVSSSTLLTAVSILPHENKISVLHMNLSQTTQCDNYGNDDLPVKSKDVFHFRCGWRTWKAKPVFSQNNLNCDKHKFERYMPTEGSFFSASVLGPVTYTPCPVLMFRKPGQMQSQLVALGSIFNADADRIVVKRIILTGYPTRVHKRHATVKYMFYNPDDVKVSYNFLFPHFTATPPEKKLKRIFSSINSGSNQLASQQSMGYKVI
jgi:pre-rRNA-processing protein TSR1